MKTLLKGGEQDVAKGVVVKIEVTEIAPAKQARLAAENSAIIKNMADMTELPQITQRIYRDMAI